VADLEDIVSILVLLWALTKNADLIMVKGRKLQRAVELQYFGYFKSQPMENAATSFSKQKSYYIT
jgi:hypothetical protein